MFLQFEMCLYQYEMQFKQEQPSSTQGDSRSVRMKTPPLPQLSQVSVFPLEYSLNFFLSSDHRICGCVHTF